FFYARVSSIDQSLERQLEAAREVGIDEEYIFIDKASGKDFKRPEYQLMKHILREGDILYVKSLDRLGRNKQMILDEWQGLVKNNLVAIDVFDMLMLNTMKDKDVDGLEILISDLILQLLSYMAEDERKRTKERQEEGIRIAKERGVKFGRKKQEIDDTYRTVYPIWKQNKITDVEIMRKIGIKRNKF